MIPIYFLLLPLPDEAETPNLALQGNPKWCKASFLTLGMSPYISIVREKLCEYIYNNKHLRRNSTSPFIF